MPRHDTPIVLITRPAEDAKRFLAAVEAISGPIEAIISPAFEYETLTVDLPDFEMAVFTSKVGVAHAPLGAGRTAWCVGAATAQAARAAGYQTISADGSAEDVIALILERKPTQKLLHVRGEISRGDVMNSLTRRGLTCGERVVYRKAPQAPSAEFLTGIDAGRAFIIPLFSAETVSILKKWRANVDGQMVVAISDVVAQCSRGLNPLRTVVSSRPDMDAMARATSRLIA